MCQIVVIYVVDSIVSNNRYAMTDIDVDMP